MQESGDARGKVLRFLVKLLANTMRTNYEAALKDFNNNLRQRGVVLDELTESQLDWTVAEFIVDKHEESNDTSFGLASCMCLVAALSKRNPRWRFTVSHKVLDIWRQLHPPRQAVPMPVHLLWAIVSWLVVAQEISAAACILVCFSGLLRASKALSLTKSTFIRGISCYVAILGKTKRGLEQKVVIENRDVVAWLDRYFKKADSLADRFFIVASTVRSAEPQQLLDLAPTNFLTFAEKRRSNMPLDV